MKISPEQRAFFKEQLGYSHLDHIHPPNTQVAIDMEHQFIVDEVRSFAKKNPVHMLDIGCGWGDFSEKLDPYLASYVGVDPSVSELRRFNLRPKRYVMRGVGEFLDFVKDRSRNFILLNSVIDHAFDTDKLFVNCFRILVPGGLMIISMENAQKFPARLKHWLGRKVVHEGHFSFWGVTEVERVLRPDFNIIQKRTFGFLYGFHQLTKKVPLPTALLRPMNRLANKVAGYIAPNAGTYLFVSAIRKGDAAQPTNFDRPLCCPNCHADWDYTTQTCPACRCEFPYVDGKLPDTIKMNSELRQDVGVPQGS
ncbi:MAG TPA: methyltransferase domain-containing protein [Verrucomicrobiae bacterium]|nr:methyltransferase domain-containing protein [Verrucomicrobiae bacterium]